MRPGLCKEKAGRRPVKEEDDGKAKVLVLLFTFKGIFWAAAPVSVMTALRVAGLCTLRIVLLFLIANIAATFLIVMLVIIPFPGIIVR